jgi:hypothetical protein
VSLGNVDNGGTVETEDMSSKGKEEQAQSVYVRMNIILRLEAVYSLGSSRSDCSAAEIRPPPDPSLI